MLKTLGIFFRLMRSRRKKLYASIVLSFVDGFLIIVPLLVAFRFIGTIAEAAPDTGTLLTPGMVAFYTAVMVVCVIARIVLRYFTLRLRSGVGYEVMCEERKGLGRELRGVSMGYFSQENLGSLVATITSDTALVEIEGMGVVEKVAIGVPSIAIGLGVLLVFDWRIALAAGLLLIPAWFAYRWLAGIQDKLDNRSEQVGEVTEEIVEFINGLPVLKTYNLEQGQLVKTRAAFARLRKLSVDIELQHMPPLAVFQFCFRLITAVIIIGLAGIFAIWGQLGYPDAFLLRLGSFTLFSGAEMMGVWQIFGRMSQAAIERMDKIRDVPQMDATGEGRQATAFGIDFEGVNFSYQSVPVLENVSFCVPARTTTALVGPSGSGKTTITSLVARFWDVQSGHVRVGGQDVRALDYEALLKDISFVFQDVFLFHDTVLLDEVTAGLDVENEYQVQRALQALLQGRTVIMIAHKLATVQNVDQILVLEEGKISQKGTHSQLMARGGLYRRLWDMQYQTGKWRV